MNANDAGEVRAVRLKAALILTAGFAALVIHASAFAQGAPFCNPGEQPTFHFGFATLKEKLGSAMGAPVECEHPNSANGDTLQKTTTGLAFYRKSTNTPTFTDGYRHWGLNASGVVSWEGSAVDPPASTVSTGMAIAPFTPFAGLWWHHGFSLQVWEDGHALAEWRTYQTCGPSVVGPCDQFRGNQIINGGQAYLAFDALQGASARGAVTSSSDPKSLHTGQVTLTLMPYGMARFEQDGAGLTLCGPRYLTEAPESVVRSTPCGA